MWSPETVMSNQIERAYESGEISACVATWRYEGIEVWRFGCALQALPQKRYEVMDACCRRSEMEYGGMELWRRDVGVATWRH